MKKTVQGILAMLVCSLAFQATAQVASRPNILLIMVDDLGFSDVGAFGGEIETPNIDELASKGKMLTSFYVAPACSPTRAMLMSGTDHHLAGFGTLKEVMTDSQLGKPGYEGHLNFRSLSFVDLLRNSGYHTYITGKWHLGEENDQLPVARGFTRSFALIDGAAHYFDDTGFWEKAPKATYRESGQKVTSLPEDFYATDYFTDRLINFIDQDLKSGNPFFAFASYTAPHWPLQVPDEDIDKYRGKYDGGYEAVRDERIKKIKELGIFNDSFRVAERLPASKNLPDWKDLGEEERKIESRKMEIYAALVDRLDQNIGRLISHLKSIDAYENTFIVFMSDNGPDGADLSKASWLDWSWIEATTDNSYDNMGRKGSYIYQGPRWAEVSSTPFSLFKGYPTEGGITSPTIIVSPAFVKEAGVVDSIATVKDLAPTFLELAGIPTNIRDYQGREVYPLQGASMLPMLSGEKEKVHEDDYIVGRELYGRRGIRQGDWKAVRIPAQGSKEAKWVLYNIASDRGEVSDLAKEYPEKLEHLINLWGQYAKENNVMH